VGSVYYHVPPYQLTGRHRPALADPVADTACWIEMCGVADLIWLESPSNPLLTMADLDVICAAPRKRGAILGVDNTFATPLNQRPLALGADVAVQSVTKFIGGHSDLLGGVVTMRDANLLAAVRQSRELAGANTRDPGNFPCGPWG
jgi:cystathionine gamma-synthase